jgi:hypothetical protein
MRKVRRDACNRPTPVYNHNYNLKRPPRKDLPGGYTPYVFNEPLFDDREVQISRLPKHYIVASEGKRSRTAWVWKLGYALTDTKKVKNKTV